MINLVLLIPFSTSRTTLTTGYCHILKDARYEHAVVLNGKVVINHNRRCNQFDVPCFVIQNLVGRLFDTINHDFHFELHSLAICLESCGSAWTVERLFLPVPWNRKSDTRQRPLMLALR
ncbi:hypothetical protein MPTK1_1g28010 [Marchantia polymorpha subsp. ruderalis]|uniref:Uncharacterized protein n=2 Tax=Marchantia polymorpha TaxID=3197 RepID=A0AAF6AV32_MARPO|nr:hypothetical protein MARPO_0002s0077 [Marchantia polymorpha]BBN00303.1 hypothetical protein Mp_1g28010 [Marchantia polymorpha subsp. ruderalis]|eukprot:PTQ49580.1 hypothetical protein MARPO_0002s0077 [Marchantia polymorpha]